MVQKWVELIPKVSWHLVLGKAKKERDEESVFKQRVKVQMGIWDRT